VVAAASIFAGGLDLVFPPRCAFCGVDLDQPRRQAEGCDAPASATGPARVITVPAGRPLPVCDPCRRSVSACRPRCGRCGAPGGRDDAGLKSGGRRPAGEAGCPRCRRYGPVCDGVVVFGTYADELRGLVLRAKRPSGEPVAAALAALLVDRHRDRLVEWGIDLVVPVPMHWRRRLVRGTSSADELARGVAAGLGRPRRRLLRRVRATRMQNELPVADRPDNVRDAFRCRGSFLRRAPAALLPTNRPAAGRRLLLVDDVMTTGSTLMACREAALSAGVAAVYAAVVARADRGGDGDDH